MFIFSEFLCGHFNIEDTKNCWQIMLNYFKKHKNAPEMCVKRGLQSFMLEISHRMFIHSQVD